MKNDTNDWWQPELFRNNTKQLLPPELEILADPPPEKYNYNCFLYVLGLHTNGVIITDTNGFIYDTFIRHLLTTGDLTKTTEPQDGDFVAYQDLLDYPNALTHAGVLHGKKVVSKWAWGPLVKHDLWDVPAEYGDAIFFINAITPTTAFGLYKTNQAYNILPA